MAADSVEARSQTVNPVEAAKRLGLSPRTLANLRTRRAGPPYLKVVGRVRYRLCDLSDWLDGRVHIPGADQ